MAGELSSEGLEIGSGYSRVGDVEIPSFDSEKSGGSVESSEGGGTARRRDGTENSRQSDGEKSDEPSHHDGDGAEGDLLLPRALLLPRLESAAAPEDPRRRPARNSVDEEFPGVPERLAHDEGGYSIDERRPSSVLAGRRVDERCGGDESIGSSERFPAREGPRRLEWLLREWIRPLLPYGPSHGATNGVTPRGSFRRGYGIVARCWLA